MLRAFRPRAVSCRALGATGALLLLATTAAACSSGTSAASSGSVPVSTLVIANAVRPGTLDPEANSVNESIWLDQSLYSRLLQPNATGTGLLPDLASSWTISNNGPVCTFHLRDAKLSNGQPVTASDVVFSIDRSRKFADGRGLLLTPVKTIIAPDPHPVVITLSVPHAPLLADLAMYAYSIVPQAWPAIPTSTTPSRGSARSGS